MSWKLKPFKYFANPTFHFDAHTIPSLQNLAIFISSGSVFENTLPLQPVFAFPLITTQAVAPHFFCHLSSFFFFLILVFNFDLDSPFCFADSFLSFPLIKSFKFHEEVAHEGGILTVRPHPHIVFFSFQINFPFPTFPSFVS